MQPYDHLVALSKKSHLLGTISMLLEWDLETYMPKGAIDLRSAQTELLASLTHHHRTSSEFKQALSALVDLETGTCLDPSLSKRKQAAIREFRRDYLNEVKLPISFVEEWAKVTAEATHVWSEAKEKDDFKRFQPHLEKIVELSRKKAEHLGYQDHPYDALLDYFEPGSKCSTLTPLFEKLKIPLVDLLKKITARPSTKADFLKQLFPHDEQLKFGKKILAAMGFDPSFSRLDESAHPMCIPAHPRDMRMTTRIYPSDVSVNILSCIHEGGHGLYHSNLPVEDFGTPLCEAVSLGIDESQSRTWETLIGRSLPFWKHWYPQLQEAFPKRLGNVRLEAFYQAINTVRPSFIRTDSDEVTYNLHIMIRYELERAMIEGSLKVKDLPEAWNEKMLNFLGITPPSASLGVLQDIHWSLGAIGYFSTYTLGNLYAAQFFETLSDEHPDWKERIASGDLTFISCWQKENIHQFGREFLPEELCKRITSKPLSVEPFIRYLETKYTPLYHL